MSLYNQLFGVDPLAEYYLRVIGLKRESIPCFRDCYLWCEKTGELRICLYARIGGNNRKDYRTALETLSRNMYWLSDTDDDFDPTFCIIEFSIPDDCRDDIESLISTGEAVMAKVPAERWRQLIDKLKKGDVNDPEVKRALEIGDKIFAQVDNGQKVIKV